MSAIPTPKRLSFGGGASNAGTPTAKSRRMLDDPEAGAAFQDVMRSRPPSSLSHSVRPPSRLEQSHSGDLAQSTSSLPLGSTKTASGTEGFISKYGNVSLGMGSPDTSSPRTPVPASRRAPSTYLRQSVLAQSNSSTPSRATSSSFRTPTAKPRSSLSAQTAPIARTASTSRPTTPTTESRSRRAMPPPRREEFQPAVGDHVCIASLGNFEGVVRYIGPIEGKVGTFAGIELDAGFAGKGKNDGSVAGQQYFSCPPNCGVFAFVEKLSRVQARAPSVASSVRSNSTAGRATPALPSGRATPAHSIASGASGRETPFIQEDSEPESDQHDNMMPPPLARSTRVNQLARSTTENAMTPKRLKAGVVDSQATLQGRLTEGSRASRLAGMKANQLTGSRLAAQRAMDVTADSVNGATPRPMRQSIGGPGLTAGGTPSTPSRTVSMSAARMKSRQSIGGANSTPKPALKSGRMSVTGRQSVVHDSMPPPPSPSKYGAIGRANTSTEVSEANQRAEQQQMINVELLNKIEELQKDLAAAQAEPKTGDWVKVKKEQEQRINDLTVAQEFTSREASAAVIKAEKLEAKASGAQKQLDAALNDVEHLKIKLVTAETTAERAKKELQVQKERSEEEYELGMKTKRQEVKEAEARAEDMQKRLDHELLMKQEMIETAQQLQMVYEKKLGDAQHKQFQQDSLIRELEDKVAEALRKQNAPAPSAFEVAREAETAAEIENENLKAQVEHQQKKIASLEDQIEEQQVQIEKETEIALKNNEKFLANERKHKDDVSQLRSDMSGLREQLAKSKDRVADLEHALKDHAKTLAGAQAEIENNRLDLAELENMRMAQGLLNSVQKERDILKEEIVQLKARVKQSVDSSDVETQLIELQHRHSGLEAKHQTLEAAYQDLQSKHQLGLPSAAVNGQRVGSTDSDSSRKPRLSAGASDLEKQVIGLRQMIDDLQSENGELYQTIQDLSSQIKTSDDDNKELAIANKQIQAELEALQSAIESRLDPMERASEKGSSAAGDDAGEVAVQEELSQLRKQIIRLEEDRTALQAGKAKVVADLTREIEELESLVETKMWREEELEHQVTALEEQLQSNKATSARQASAGTCVLCSGAHDMENCPRFRGDTSMTDGENSPGPSQNGDSPLFSKSTNVLQLGKSNLAREQVFCDNCATSRHRTQDCPDNDDTF